MQTDFAKPLYEALLAEPDYSWTASELATLARIIERDWCLSERERSALLECVNRKREAVIWSEGHAVPEGVA